MTITSYGLTAALAMAAALLTAGLWCRRQQTGFGPWIRLCVLALPLAFVCSRILFAVSTWFNGTLFTSPLQMLYFWDGGASVTGAFAGMLIAAALTEKHCRIPRGTLLDAVALGAPIGMIIERFAEPAVDLGIGRYVDTEWLYFLGDMTDGRHPVFLYQAVMALIILAALTAFALQKGGPKHRGDLLLIFMTLYGCSQVVLESLKDDGHMVIYFIRINQIAGLAMALTAFVLWVIRWRKKGAGTLSVVISCVLVLAAVAQGVVQEFAVDSNPNLLLEYGIMALCCAVIAAASLIIRRKAE